MSDQAIPPVPQNQPVTVKEKEPNFFSENKKLVTISVIIILMLVFIFENMDQVQFWLLFFPIRLPMVIVILLFFSIGAISVYVYSYFHKKELKKKIKALEARLKKYE